MNVQTNNWINVIHSTLHLQPSRFNRGERKNPIKKIRSEKSTRKVNQKILTIQV